jgi:hypothetical protein
VGAIYEGKVARLMDFGAFVTILPGKDGLVHISQISDERVERVSDKLKEGDVVRVKVLGSRPAGPGPSEHAERRRGLTAAPRCFRFDARCRRCLRAWRRRTSP